MDFRVATLNCWALPGPWPIGSKNTRFRLEKLIDAVASSNYDVIALEELWSEKYFLQLVNDSNVRRTYGYSHYFHSGLFGSGLCVLSKHRIISTLMHRYSLNGYPHHIHRGDWFGGKVVGMVEIELGDSSIAFYITHLHAQYNHINDTYMSHRLTQCFELAHFIHHTSRQCLFVILVGDLNVEPDNIGYKLVRGMTHLNDAWDSHSARFIQNDHLQNDHLDEQSVAGMGYTYGRPDNSFTSILTSHGTRIDYVLFRDGNANLELSDCSYCFDKIPDSDFSYSDHTGVSATFTISKKNPETESVLRKRNVETAKILEDTGVIVKNKIDDLNQSRVIYLILSFFFSISILGCSFVTTVDIPFPKFIVVFFMGVFGLLLVFLVWQSLIAIPLEIKALKETMYSIKKLLKLPEET